MEQKKLGTFLGVFTPTVLTILGVIMYMRFGWVVGHMGLFKTLIIVSMANAITLITTLSFSSVATNQKVGGGGAYYIISRSLGLSIGGAVGVPLFLSQVFSVTLYCYGLAETLHFLIPVLPVQPVAFITIIIVAGLSFKGAEFALKSQVPIMLFVLISIAFVALGAFFNEGATAVRFSESSGEIPFFAAFAIFFPAVTGIMAGLGLSGDLKDPQKSIPIGAILAVITGFIVYISLPFLLVKGASDLALQKDTMVWSGISPLGAIVIIPGLLGAIFSSAVGSMLGAPRTFQALVNDQFSKPFFTKIFNGEKGFKIIFVFSVIISLSAVFLGELNSVATVVTIFFLTVYGVINIAAAFESLSGEPSWRPKFNIPWIISIAGGFSCFAVMFLISPQAGVAAVLIEFMIYMLIKRKADKMQFGDARRGVYETLIKNSLFKLRDHPMTARNWRPYIQIFVNDYKSQKNLVSIASSFGHETGIVTITQLIIGILGEDNIPTEKITGNMSDFYKSENLHVFPEVNVIEDFESGIISAIQANGMAGLTCNTVMICWPDEIAYLSKHLSIMRRIASLHRSFVIGKIKNSDFILKKQKVIHIWWGGLQRNGDLMLLLAHLLKQSQIWKNSTIKVISIALNESIKDTTQKNLLELIPETRIHAEPMVVVKPADKSFIDIIHETSADADMVFLGLNTPAKGEEDEYAQRLVELAGDLKTVFFVKNSSMFMGKLLDSDS